MSRKPRSHFERWTPAKIAMLMRHVAEGVSFRGIAKELGRTTESVEHRAGIERRAREASLPTPAREP